jgi:hypothetical protein
MPLALEDDLARRRPGWVFPVGIIARDLEDLVGTFPGQSNDRVGLILSDVSSFGCDHVGGATFDAQAMVGVVACLGNGRSSGLDRSSEPLSAHVSECGMLAAPRVRTASVIGMNRSHPWVLVHSD